MWSRACRPWLWELLLNVVHLSGPHELVGNPLGYLLTVLLCQRDRCLQTSDFQSSVSDISVQTRLRLVLDSPTTRLQTRLRLV